MAKTSKPSLAETHPELAAQADGWDPNLVPYSSHRNVPWKCTFGHGWNSIMSNRAKGSGCPVCSNKAVLPGYNDLATTHPELAKEADGWDPNKVSFGIGKKLRWKCSLGHTWNISPNARSSKKSGCPICSNQEVLIGFNDLLTTHPEIASQARGWDPTSKTAGSSKTKVNWECPKGHVWSAIVADRTSGGKGCAVCAGKQINIGFNDLATTHPDLAAEADGWEPTTTTSGSDRRFGWICKHGHKWTAAVSTRVSGSGCPVCVNKVVVTGYNDLATTHPELAKEADGWDPTKVSFGIGKKLRWKCSLGHTWNISPNGRSNRGSGCPVCAGNVVLKGFNDLESIHPQIAAEAFNWDPSTVTRMSNIVRVWICSLGHTWRTAPAHRAIGQGCPVCSNQKVLAGFNDLATTHPELAKEADGWDPKLVVAGSNKRFSWKCNLGHIWKAGVNRRSAENHPTGCPVCSNQKLLTGFNDLATTHPELAAEADGWDPKLVFAGSNKHFFWKCNLGHKWKAKGNNRINGKGCPVCAIYGFNPGKDGWLYLIDNDARDMFQIGISNVPENRLDRHSRGGWEVIEVRGPMDGFLTQELERSSLMALKRRGAILGRKGSLEKFDGYTEAWTKESLKVTSIKQLLDWVYEDESQ
jgi:hypothetical protein